MKNRTLTYPLWLLACMLVQMLAACSSSASEGGLEGGGTERKSAKLAIYVYAPEQAAAQTRADEGLVDPVNNTLNEGIIKSLKLWIYETTTGNKVGYFNTEDVEALNEGQGATYQIPVSDEFAASKPDVDVYVMANVTASNCGVGTLNESTSRAELIEGAKISGHFGLYDIVKSVPADGLPFAGKLTARPVVGDAPALRVGTEAVPSTVELTRAVSKLRFVFSKATGSPEVKITSIKIDAEMIPNEEYLFEAPASVTYNASESELLSSDIDDIAETADPLAYSYDNQDAQDYEDLINGAESKTPQEVTVYGPIYLRESDRQLTGTITYTIDGVAQDPASFTMTQAGDFSRNHTWIVYAYYAGSGNLKVQTIYVKNWRGREVNRDFYNW